MGTPKLHSIKDKTGSFFYLYLQKGTGKSLVPGHDLKFAGLYVRKNYNLYDVDMKLVRYLVFRKK